MVYISLSWYNIPELVVHIRYFLDRGLLLTRKLLNQGFLLAKLRSSLRKFYGRHYDCIDSYRNTILLFDYKITRNWWRQFVHENACTMHNVSEMSSRDLLYSQRRTSYNNKKIKYAILAVCIIHRKAHSKAIVYRKRLYTVYFFLYFS
jgi:hypothetical protein